MRWSARRMLPRMSVIVLLIAAGGLVAGGFLGAFLWAVRSGQFDDVEHAGRPRAARTTTAASSSDAFQGCQNLMTTIDADLDAEPPVATPDPRRRDVLVRQRHRPASSRSRPPAWGLVAFLVGLIVALKLVFPEFLGGIPHAVVRPPAAAAHQRGDLRVRRQRDLRRRLLLAAAAVQGADVQRSAERAFTSGAGS